MEKNNISIRNIIRKILSEHISEAFKTSINRKVEWNSHTKQGKAEGLVKGQIIYAIGGEKFCYKIQKSMENKSNGSESYSYMVAKSQIKPGAFVLIQNWEGFYD